MVDFTVFQNFFVALALGALIGLEREYARYQKRTHDYAGIRTFPLIALFGALSAYLGNLYSVYVLIAGIVLMGLLIVVAYMAVNKKTSAYPGATSEVAGFLTFFLGVLAYQGETLVATVLAVAITLILYARSMLHRFAEKMEKKEMADTLKFVVIAFVILPFLPDKGYGPLEIFNPHFIWLMVVFISAISFAGYISMKWFGERGVTLAGLLGGLASSTAVTSSFALRSTKEYGIYRSLAMGVILANGVMFIRILIEVFVLNTQLFGQVVLPLGILAVVTVIFSYWLWRKAASVKGKVKVSSPFSLAPALKFALFFTAVLALVKVAHYYLLSEGIYLISFLSGFADVDPITLTLSQLAKNGLALETAQDGIIIAALTNIATKAGVAYWLGGKEFSKIIVSFFAVLIVLGVVLVGVL